MSLAKPPLGRDLGGVVSVNTAGSRGADPYTLVLDFTTSRLTFGDFWQAPSSCIVPMTLVSLTAVRLPLPSAVALTSMWTTVSAPVSASTARDGGLPDVGLDEVGSAQMVLGWHRVHGDDPVDLRVTLDPSYEPAPQLRATPVTSTTLPKISAFLPAHPVLVACRVPRVRPT